MSVFLPIPFWVYYYISVRQLEIRMGDTFSSGFIIHYFGCCVPISIQKDKNCPFDFCEKNVLEFWWGLYWICSYRMVTFSIFILPIHKYGNFYITWYLLFLLQYLTFLLHKSWICLVRDILSYFWGYCEKHCFLDCYLRLFNHFYTGRLLHLCVNVISCYCTESLYQL